MEWNYLVGLPQADGWHCAWCALSHLHLMGQKSFSPGTAYQCKIFLSRRTNYNEVFTWIWEICLAWYHQAVITGTEIGAGINLSHRIIVSAHYRQSMKLLKVGGHLHCALYDAVSNDGFYIPSNAFWTAFLFLLALNRPTVLTSLLTATRIHMNSIAMCETQIKDFNGHFNS